MNTENPQSKGNPDSEVVIRIQVYAGDAQPVSEHEIRPSTTQQPKPAPLAFPPPEPVKPVFAAPKVSPAWRSIPERATNPTDDTSIDEVSSEHSKLNEPVGWFVRTKDGEVGPLHIIQVAKAVGQGRIGPGTLLRHNGRNITVFACCIPGLFPPRVYNPLIQRLQKEEQDRHQHLKQYLQELLSESLATMDALQDDELSPLRSLIKELLEAKQANESAA